MDDRTNPPLPQQHLLPHNLLLLRLHNLTLRHFQTQSGSEHSVTEMFGAPPKCVRRRVDVSFHNMVFLEPYALFGGIIVILIKLAYIRHVKRDLLSRMSPSTPIHFSNKSKFVFVLPHGSSPSSDFVDITKHIPRDSIDSRIYFVDKSSPQQSLSIMQLEKNLSTHVSTPYQIILLPLGKTSSFNYFSNFYRCFAVFFRVLLTFLGTSPRFIIFPSKDHSFVSLLAAHIARFLWNTQSLLILVEDPTNVMSISNRSNILRRLNLVDVIITQWPTQTNKSRQIYYTAEIDWTMDSAS